jgi:hypothetical protein
MHIRILGMLVICVLFTGCAATTLGMHQPSADAVISLRDSNLVPLNVGTFKLADGVKPDIDHSITSRGNVLESPDAHSFALYLRDALLSDLKAAGKYDANSMLLIQGELLDSQLTTGMSQGSAVLAAHFSVTRGGQIVFDKQLHQESQWDSSFLGAVAIPAAFNNYAEQYGLLLQKLYADPEFRKACVASP